MKRFATSFLVLLGLLVIPAFVRAEELSFVAVLNHANEVPAISDTDSSLTGVSHLIVDTATNKGRIEVYLFDLAPDRTLLAAHIHRGPAGENGPVIYPLATSAFASPLTREFDFNPDDLADLMAGNLYVNVHTNVFPGGEARGQLEAGELRGLRVTLTAHLAPENEVPPTGLDAGGSAEITLDLKLMGNKVVAASTLFDVDYRFSTSVTLVGLHVHKGPPGVNGPVVISSGLRATADADGRGNIGLKVSTSKAADLAIFEEILRDPGAFYSNLHTSVFPGGAIRGTLERRRLGV
jgi:hypothetical protein